jgi:hypothetical protein
MSMRALAIVAAALVILSGIAYFAAETGPSGRDAPAADTHFAPMLGAVLDQVETIEIEGAGGTTKVTLNRGQSGWTVAQKDGYAADTGKIRTALTALADAKIVEAKTANPALHDRLGVADVTSDEARGVMIGFLPASLGLPHIVLGDPEGTSYRYARLADDDQSYLIDANPAFPGDAAEWVVPTILDVRGTRVERVVIRHADGEELVLFKDAVDQMNYSVADIPAGRELQYPGVANVIGNALRELRLEDVAADDEAALEPEVVTEFETFDGLVVRAEGLRIGDEGWFRFRARIDEQFSAPDETIATEAADINGRVAGWRYRIPEYQYDQIARRMSDLLSAEEASN